MLSSAATTFGLGLTVSHSSSIFLWGPWDLWPRTLTGGEAADPSAGRFQSLEADWEAQAKTHSGCNTQGHAVSAQ